MCVCVCVCVMSVMYERIQVFQKKRGVGEPACGLVGGGLFCVKLWLYVYSDLGVSRGLVWMYGCTYNDDVELGRNNAGWYYKLITHSE